MGNLSSPTSLDQMDSIFYRQYKTFEKNLL